MLLLADPFQLPLEALQRSRGLISPNRWLTVVAVAGVHQDANVSEFFLDLGEILTEQSVLLVRERVSINGRGHVDEILHDLPMVLHEYGVLRGSLLVREFSATVRELD